ncbi:MAG TPA: hypothetical protein VKX39_06290 [Bryobacteraceae bacterium]|jgi:hypothetical protein|nr:hypothetical protein [Bryobacteraceae bacterium]
MAENTIIGVFDNQKEAEEVAEDLKREGFSGNDIHIIDEHGKEHLGWFSRLFGHKEEKDTLAYREALRKGKAVVAVDTDEEQVERAADIMERHGAIDIEDSEGEPIEPMKTHPMRGESRSTMSGGAQSIPAVEEDVGSGKSRVLHGGVRVYGHVSETREEPLGNRMKVEPAAQDASMPADVAADFSKNFRTQYAGRNYSEYEAAYNAGNRAANRIENRSKNFDEIEDQIRAEFEHSYPKCDWPQMRHAVRYGWDRARGRFREK